MWDYESSAKAVATLDIADSCMLLRLYDSWHPLPIIK